MEGQLNVAQHSTPLFHRSRCEILHLVTFALRSDSDLIFVNNIQGNLSRGVQNKQAFHYDDGDDDMSEHGIQFYQM
jgi:hypothetical protein